MNLENKNTRERITKPKQSSEQNQRSKVLERLKQIKNVETRRKIMQRMTTGLLAPLSVLAMNAEKASAAPQIPESFTPEAQRLVEGIQTRMNGDGHIFTVPGVQGEISADHVTKTSEAEKFTLVEGSNDISVEKGFDLSQIERWQLPAGQTMDAVLTTTGNITSGFEAEKFQVDCKIIGISYTDMWAETGGENAQLVVCLQDGQGYDIYKGNSGSGLILENGAVAVTSMHNYPLFAGEKQESKFTEAIAVVQAEMGVDEATATKLVDGGGFFEIFGKPTNAPHSSEELPDQGTTDLFGTLSNEELQNQSNPQPTSPTGPLF